MQFWLMLLLSWCLMSSDVIWHIRDKLWPMPKHGSIRMVYACLAVTCHLHFWQNGRDFLRATVVTRGWNGYRNKSQHRKSTLEKKILPPFQQGFEPATFQSRVRRSNHWAIPAPHLFLIDWLMITYIALFSALLSRLTGLTCGSAWVTSFIAHFLISTELVYLISWHGWCHMKLQPSWHKSCVHHVTSCKATYVRCMRVNCVMFIFDILLQIKFIKLNWPKLIKLLKKLFGKLKYSQDQPPYQNG